MGCGALSTDRRPARINTKKLLGLYAQQCRPEWGFGAPDRVASALLPMGGAVSGVAGRNWMLIGDAAACVNPLNGEGIDYGMETARLAVECLGAGKDYTLLWPDVLRREYGEAFGLARMLARLLTYPQLLPVVGPVALRRPLGRHVMPVAARLMGNLITDAESGCGGAVVACGWPVCCRSCGGAIGVGGCSAWRCWGVWGRVVGLVSDFGCDRGYVGFYGGVEGDDATGQVLPPAV